MFGEFGKCVTFGFDFSYTSIVIATISSFTTLVVHNNRRFLQKLIFIVIISVWPMFLLTFWVLYDTENQENYYTHLRRRVKRGNNDQMVFKFFNYYSSVLSIIRT